MILDSFGSDSLEAMKIAKSKGAKVLAIVNAEGSTIAREADYTLLINAGPERAVASTKALTGQMAVLMMIAYAMVDQLHEGKTLLLDTVSSINDMLNAAWPAERASRNSAQTLAPGASRICTPPMRQPASVCSIR